MDVRESSSSAPTLEDVARAAGVCRATVSRVVNAKPDVAPGIQRLVQDAIDAIGYVPNRAARSLVTRRTGVVSVVISGSDVEGAGTTGVIDFADPFFGRAVGGLLRALRPRELDPVLMLAETPRDRARVMAFLSHGNADGALLVSTHADDPLPSLLVKAGIPAVMFARPGLPVPVSYVDMANRTGGALAAEHLLARGCRRMGAISGPPDVPAARDRLAGFTDTLAARGVAWVPRTAGSFTRATGVEAMARLLDAHPDLDAVFASNDLMALGVIDVLRTRGVRVPEDVAVIGFDDSPLAAVAHPALTTIRQPIEEMTAEMVRLLLAQVAEPDLPPTSVILEPELIARDSA
jgi:DNA-binding LacI/PurR family transcriptional regulator